VSHTFSPEADRRAEALGTAATFVAAVVAVVVFFPAEGHVLKPIHGALESLFGHAAFVLPLGLTFAGALALVRRARPNLPLPERRMVGLGLITVALLPADELLGQSTGLLGEWFTGFLLELLGAPLTIAFVLALVAAGVALTFDVLSWRHHPAAR
jgi:hypothetical protein